MEAYPSWRRGFIANEIGRAIGAKVRVLQLPPLKRKRSDKYEKKKIYNIGTS